MLSLVLAPHVSGRLFAGSLRLLEPSACCLKPSISITHRGVVLGIISRALIGFATAESACGRALCRVYPQAEEACFPRCDEIQEWKST